VIRLFKVYYPLRTLVLLAGEALIVWLSFVAGDVGGGTRRQSWLLLNLHRKRIFEDSAVTGDRAAVFALV
jgi:hypothetical protein